ncbi:MAG: PIN/TRAM domain-containing protein [Planctomycetes bacterium]|nr:PIN/TRAM domain-containing protein [Planctomycetota bacterium]
MLHVIRGLFVLVCSLLGWQLGVEVYRLPWWEGLLFGFLTGFCCAILEMSFARRFISILSVLMFGVVVGFLASYFVIGALDLIPGFAPPDPPASPLPPATQAEEAMRVYSNEHASYLQKQNAYLQEKRAYLYRNYGIMFVLSFLSVLTILHTKDDFKFVIPFVELRREGKTGRPMLVDTSTIIDGRIADVIETKVIDTPIIVPRFVLDELQAVADSQDKMKRTRGRRGLDILNRMRKSKGADIQVQDVTLLHVEGVDAKLVRFAKMIDARIVTNDFNLNKVAQVQGVEVININDLANALKPILLQGEKIALKILRTGESPGQGVGYLDDGTMVVAEECANRIGQVVDLTVTNVLQTSAGRLVFGKPGEGAARG